MDNKVGNTSIFVLNYRGETGSDVTGVPPETLWVEASLRTIFGFKDEISRQWTHHQDPGVFPQIIIKGAAGGEPGLLNWYLTASFSTVERKSSVNTVSSVSSKELDSGGVSSSLPEQQSERCRQETGSAWDNTAQRGSGAQQHFSGKEGSSRT